MKRHICLIFVLIIALSVSSCVFYDKYKLTEYGSVVERRTNIRGEVKVFYAFSRFKDSWFGVFDWQRLKTPIYGITEPHLVDDISCRNWSFIFFPYYLGELFSPMAPVKIEIVKKDNCYWVSETCYQTPAELSLFIVDLLQKIGISPEPERDKLIDDIEKLISDAFKK